jgi:phospholipid/cholesterol/gamma-HCH transport system substrate-binding protein
MANNAIETVMGAVVLVVAGGFLYFAYDKSNVKPIDGYTLTASFSNISGIAPGSAVRVGGIKIGVIEDLTLDTKSYQAVAKLRIEDNVTLPRDSSAAIQSTGLIGEKFLAVEPGGEEDALKDGDKIAFTQPSVSLEEMIGKFMFSGGGADNKAKDKADAGTEEKPADAEASLPTLE